MDSGTDGPALPGPGFPIRKSPGQSLFGSYPKLIAAFHVLHRLPAPRHPPYTLSCLTALGSFETMQSFFAKKRVNVFPQFDCQRAGSAAETAVLSPRADALLAPTRRTHVCAIALVETIGLEPTTSWLQTRRSPVELRPRRRPSELAFWCKGASRRAVVLPGGPNWIRTSDLSVISRTLCPTEL